MADNLKRLVYTVVTSDHYQHYIPLWAYRIQQCTDADVRVAIRGALDSLTADALNCISADRLDVQENMFLEYPYSVSTTNTLRFMRGQHGYDEVLIMDADLMIFEDPFPWHEQHLIDQTYCGHRGPQSKPYRPEISESGWVGEFERVAGGFFMATPRWYDATRLGREAAMIALMHNIIGTFREADEVTLARLIKSAGLNMPQSKHFPIELRGLHMGDFRENMRHRWTSPAKMQRKLSDDNARRYYTMLHNDSVWGAMTDILKADPDMLCVLNNIQTHLQQRGVV